MSTQATEPSESGRRLTPADVHNARFARAAMMRPGYNDAEVDAFLGRVAEEMSRLIEEKSQLRSQLRALQQRADEVVAQEPPSEQALRILSSAQLTADNYVAEAEEFSRQVTSEARAQYEEQVRQARENAGAIIQAAQEAAARVARGGGGGGAAPATAERSVEELQEQVAYLKAFSQACRVQLRSYLEALLSDVETEWGRADPAALPQLPLRTPAQRSDSDTPEGSSATFHDNTAGEPGNRRESDAKGQLPAPAASRSSS